MGLSWLATAMWGIRMLNNFLRLKVIIGTLPVALANGTTADATQVMSDLNWIVNQVNANAGTSSAAALAVGTGASLIGFIQAGAGAVATDLQTKNRQIVSVKDFFAVGDGATNDTAAVQAAINSLNISYGGTIRFPKPEGNDTGSYLCGSLTIPAGMTGLTLEGDSNGGSIISYSGATGKLFVPLGSLSNCAIKNLYCSATGHTSGWCMDFQQATLGVGTAITGISRASPGVVSTGTTPINGQVVYISGVVGMTQVNDNYYTVAGVVLNTSFQLTDPNTGAVVTTNYTAWSSGGTWQLVTAENVTRDLCIENFTITGFKNGIRSGQTINSRIQRGRIITTAGTPTLTSDAIALQIGDSGFQGTTTTISNVYCVGNDTSHKWGTALWNKYCPGLVLDNFVADFAMIALRGDAYTVGTMQAESVSGTSILQSITGTAPCDITALNTDFSGVSGATYGDIAGWTSAGQSISKLRGNTQWLTRASLVSAPITMIADAAFHTIVFDTSNINPNINYSVSTGLYTAAVSGLYRVTAKITINATAGQTGTFRIVANGTAAGERALATVPTEATFQVALDDVVFVPSTAIIDIEYKYSAAVNIIQGAVDTYVIIERLT